MTVSFARSLSSPYSCWVHTVVSCDVDSASIRRRHLAAAPGTSYTRSHGCGVQHGQSTSRHLQRNKKADLFPYADMRPLGRKNFFLFLETRHPVSVSVFLVYSLQKMSCFLSEKGHNDKLSGYYPTIFSGFLFAWVLKLVRVLKSFSTMMSFELLIIL